MRIELKNRSLFVLCFAHFLVMFASRTHAIEYAHLSMDGGY